MSERTGFDYGIVGAGSAGCVLANRLSEDPAYQVLLVEAGGSDRSIVIDMPAAAPLAARDPRFGWGYVCEPEPHLFGRRILAHRGRVLGGSSSINGMVANRGSPRNYDGWAAAGLATWSYAHCRMGIGDESVTDVEGRVHGVDGLRVVDASIMPHNVTANLNAPVIMMAEKLSDAIAGKPAMAPIPVPG